MKRFPLPQRATLSIALAIAALATPPAFAVNKDLVQIQTQLQQVQDTLARLQQSSDERWGVLKDLVQQNADSVNKMSVAIDGLQKQMRVQQDTTGGKIDQVSGQMQPLNDSVDEVKARLDRLEKALSDVQTQLQSINAAVQNLTPPPGAPGAVAGPTAPTGAATPAPSDASFGPQSLNAQQPADQAPIVNRRGRPSPDVPYGPNQAPDAIAPVPTAPTAPLASDLFKTAMSDYLAGKYPLASTEFVQVTRLYPNDPLSGDSYYYIGEIDYRLGKYTAAVKDYNHVIEQFPDNHEIRVSHLHKGMALFEMKQKEAGTRELRELIQRFPTSPEAATARSKLNGMGIKPTL